MTSDELIERARRLYRTLEMSAGIMRDRKRTGGWEGAERTANAFDRAAINAREIHEALAKRPAPEAREWPTPQLTRAIYDAVVEHVGALMPGRVWSPDPIIAALHEALSSLSPPGREWLPIESAPKTPNLNTGAYDLLGWCPDPDAPHGGDRRVIWWEPIMEQWFGDRDMVESPTHWQPLPSPPVSK